MVVIEKEKDTMGDNGEICLYRNMSKKSTQGNQ